MLPSYQDCLIMTRDLREIPFPFPSPTTREHTQGQSQTVASSEPSMQPRFFPQRLHEERHGTASGIKRDARTAELSDEDEGGGKFLQVEELTTVDAGEIPREFSVEDDFG